MLPIAYARGVRRGASALALTMSMCCVASGCGGSIDGTDAPRRGARDAATDALTLPDAGVEAGVDASMDAATLADAAVAQDAAASDAATEPDATAPCLCPPDDNPCTDEFCNGNGECVSAPNQASCGETDCNDIGSCSYVDQCAEMGEQSVRCTAHVCQQGQCVAQTTQHVETCQPRSTEGTACGRERCGSYGDCEFADDCVEQGLKERSCTVPRCVAGVCTDLVETRNRSCSRNTDGLSCGMASCSDFDECRFANECEATGQQSAQCTVPQCVDSICTTTTTEMLTQVCERPDPMCTSCDGIPELGLSIVETSLPMNAAAAAARADGGTALAWSLQDGIVRLATLDASGALVGNEIHIDGLWGWGLAVNGEIYVVLVQRAPDVLALVGVRSNGQRVFDTRIIGDVDHTTPGSIWFDQGYGNPRVIWTGSKYVAYYPVRFRSGGLNHQKDQQSHFGPDGRLLTGQGSQFSICSHSLDLRLTHSNGTVGQLCMRDCPTNLAGVMFMGAIAVGLEPGGDCSGHIDAGLGGFMPVPDGFWVSWSSHADRGSWDVALRHLNLNGVPDTDKVWLTNTRNIDEYGGHLAPFEDGLLIGWKEEFGKARIARLDSHGNLTHGPITTTSSFRSKDDFIVYPNGDVGWLGEGSNRALIRATTNCSP